MDSTSLRRGEFQYGKGPVGVVLRFVPPLFYGVLKVGLSSVETSPYR